MVSHVTNQNGVAHGPLRKQPGYHHQQRWQREFVSRADHHVFDARAPDVDNGDSSASRGINVVSTESIARNTEKPSGQIPCCSCPTRVAQTPDRSSRICRNSSTMAFSPGVSTFIFGPQLSRLRGIGICRGGMWRDLVVEYDRSRNRSQHTTPNHMPTGRIRIKPSSASCRWSMSGGLLELRGTAKVFPINIRAQLFAPNSAI